MFEQEKAEREITVSVRAFKYYEEKDGRMNVNQKPMAELKFRFTAKASAVDDEETIVSVEPVEYESIGVRVDRGDGDDQAAGNGLCHRVHRCGR